MSNRMTFLFSLFNRKFNYDRLVQDSLKINPIEFSENLYPSATYVYLVPDTVDHGKIIVFDSLCYLWQNCSATCIVQCFLTMIY